VSREAAVGKLVQSIMEYSNKAGKLAHECTTKSVNHKLILYDYSPGLKVWELIIATH